MSDFSRAIDQEIAALERQLEAIPVYVKLRELKRVRSLYAPSEVRGVAHGFADAVSGVIAQRKKNAPPTSGKSLQAIHAVIEILREHGSALRTLALIDRLRDRGIVFDSTSPQNTLSSLLSRSLEVESLGGHLGWGLVEWNSAGSTTLGGNAPPADLNPEAQGREAGPGGGT